MRRMFARYRRHSSLMPRFNRSAAAIGPKFNDRITAYNVL